MKLFFKYVGIICLTYILLCCEKQPPTLFDNGYYNEETKHFYFINGYLGIGALDIDNKFEGTWQFYNMKGLLIEKGEYIGGLKNGYFEFYDSGQLIESGYFDNGEKLVN